MQILANTEMLGTAGASTTVTGAAFRLGSKRAFQCTITGTGAVTGTVIVEGSNDGATYETIITFTMSDTTIAHSSQQADGNWFWTRARVTAISGTGAKARVWAASTP